MQFCVLINRLVSSILYIIVWFSSYMNKFVIFVLNNTSIISFRHTSSDHCCVFIVGLYFVR